MNSDRYKELERREKISYFLSKERIKKLHGYTEEEYQQKQKERRAYINAKILADHEKYPSLKLGGEDPGWSKLELMEDTVGDDIAWKKIERKYQQFLTDNNLKEEL